MATISWTWLVSRLLLIAIVLTASNALADTVTSVSNCSGRSIGGTYSLQQTIMGANSSSCTVGSPSYSPIPFYVTASSSVVFTITPNGQLTVAVSSIGMAAVQDSFQPGGNISGEGYADSTTSFDYELTTAGPLRTGYLKITGGGGAFENNAFPFTDVYVNGNVGVGCGPGGCPSVLNYTVPFMLGEKFSLSGDAQIKLGWDALGGLADGNADMNLTFTFLEADGVTTVQANSVPEPESVLLTLSGIAIFFSSRRVLRRLSH